MTAYKKAKKYRVRALRRILVENERRCSNRLWGLDLCPTDAGAPKSALVEQGNV